MIKKKLVSGITISGNLTIAHYLVIIRCHVSFGELNRMTQFKDKNRKKIESSFALLYYPLLMAADIMLYDADVLVGPDQKQHIELARDIEEKQRMSKKSGTN
ncbi:uncharacterized protein LOC110988000 [Acanthaster planci]|uniref:Uncharacterized protein LOC110988000 n=1 Tax=Acanthaster planci TaxID=133434 RepID=A0A8B7ZMT4_ACAPL|nr:uncharacterized protein LOC110988000 [Acanthaster planci]